MSTKPKSDIVWKTLLIVYFIAIITISIYTIIVTWAPEGIQSLQSTQGSSTITFTTSNAHEQYLIEISGLFGILGASTYGLASASVWIANKQLERSWILWYISHPLVG